MAVAGLWLSVIDAKSHRLPNIGNSLAGIAVAMVALSAGDQSALSNATVSSGLSAAFLAVIALSARRGLGWGDVKLQAVLGFYLGWFSPSLVLGQVAASFIIGGFLSLTLVVMKIMSLKDHLAFGPCMLAATWLMVLWGKIMEII